MKPKTAGRGYGKSHVMGSNGPTARFATEDNVSLHSGLTADAQVVTLRGLCTVQDLRPGDRVVTRGQGAVAVTAVAHHSVVTRAVYVIAGSLGHHRPDRDTLLPAGQTIHVRDWRAQALNNSHSVTVTAAALVDGEYVRDIGFMPLALYRIFCAQPQIIYADGMELGTAGTCAAAVKTAAPSYPC